MSQKLTPQYGGARVAVVLLILCSAFFGLRYVNAKRQSQVKDGL